MQSLLHSRSLLQRVAVVATSRDSFLLFVFFFFIAHTSRLREAVLDITYFQRDRPTSVAGYFRERPRISDVYFQSLKRWNV